MSGTVVRVLYEFSGCKSGDGPLETTMSSYYCLAVSTTVSSFEKGRRACVFAMLRIYLILIKIVFIIYASASAEHTTEVG